LSEFVSEIAIAPVNSCKLHIFALWNNAVIFLVFRMSEHTEKERVRKARTWSQTRLRK